MESVIRPSKLFSLDQAKEKIQSFQSIGKKIVLTNGCFDLLHVGHVYYLQEAAKLGDGLWILLNASDSVKQLKGDLRPIQSDMDRAFMLSALDCVLGVTLFHTKRLNNEISILQPDLYVKAGDYTMDKLDPSEREALESVGTAVKFLPFVQGYSTTSLIDRISKAYASS